MVILAVPRDGEMVYDRLADTHRPRHCRQYSCPHHAPEPDATSRIPYLAYGSRHAAQLQPTVNRLAILQYLLAQR